MSVARRQRKDDIYLGWDVGAWNCDKNRVSRDSLCALKIGDSGLKIVGSPWRGNLRDGLVKHSGQKLVEELLRRLGINMSHDHLTIAIDAPLEWPKQMIDLVTRGVITDVDSRADRNPYLFREQEISLFRNGHRPLSAVRDMIGSQSTKGIHYLHQARLKNRELGVWQNTAGSVVAIETYPAAAVRNRELAVQATRLFRNLRRRSEFKNRGEAWKQDVSDAIVCALVAWLHRSNRRQLRAPHGFCIPQEGWIWLPQIP